MNTTILRSAAAACLVTVSLAAAGGADVATNLPRVTVTAVRADRPWTHADSDAAVATLDALPEVTVQSQGGDAGQNDLSIRGSTFSGAGLSVGGLSLRNPQTEHFNLELPIPAGLLTAPDVLTGMEQALGADGHLVGTVRFDLLPVEEGVTLTAGVGEKSRHWQDALGRTTFNSGNNTVGLTLFGGQESAESVDYDDNDVERASGGGHVQIRGDRTQSDILAAYQRKEFGARGYYGVTSAWAAEEEIEDALILFNHRQQGDGDDFVRVSAAWRETRDRYTLFWTLPGVFENRHTSEVVTAFADGIQTLSGDVGASVAWRAGYEQEDVESNSLGDNHRRRGVVSVIPTYSGDHVTVRAGLRTEVFTDDAPAYLPQAGVELEAAEGHVLYATYTRTVRQPSYTELNYESPGSLGNSGLGRQETANAELGWRGTLLPETVLRAAAFHRRSRDTVDWVLPDEESTRWTATDIGTVDTLGVEVELAASLADAFDVRCLYGWLDKDVDTSVYASRYVLDYAEHMIKLAAVWRACERVRFVVTQTLRHQNDNPMRTGDDTAAHGTVSCFVRPCRSDAVELAFTADNMWDEDFQILPGQESTGRRLSGSVTVRW